MLGLGASYGCSDYSLNEKADLVSGADSGVVPVDTQAPEDSARPVDSGDTVDPSPETCSDFLPSSLPPVLPNDACNVRAPWGLFEPIVEWQWSEDTTHGGYNQVMSTPMVANLTDDNGDGRVDENDVSDIIFTSFRGSAYTSAGALTAVSGDGSGQHWSIVDAGGYRPYGSGGVAVGDIDADGSPDICVASLDATVLCLERDGTFKWASGTVPYYLGTPALADLEGDGFAEVVVGNGIFEHNGLERVAPRGGCIGRYGAGIPVDLDGDGLLEVVAGCGAFDTDGTPLWTDGLSDGMAAIGDFDADGMPEIVHSALGSMVLVDGDGAILWTSTIPGGGTGGAPTVADFDGDGSPEVGVAALSYYTVFDTDGSVLWSNPTNDSSSSVTGSSVFDFDRDGADEVVYADQFNLFVYDGATGLVRMNMSGHANGTLLEYPVIADVDNDGSTEIVLASNNYAYAGWTGITVIGDLTSTWAPARPIWNQYAYHITNIEDDGSIPRRQAANWLSWNNFRTGGTILGPSDWLPDLYVGPDDKCLVECDGGWANVWVAVTNLGRIAATDVDLVLTRAGDTTSLDSLVLPSVASGEAVWAGPFRLNEAAWTPGSLTARIDLLGAIEECDETNNSWDLGEWPCE